MSTNNNLICRGNAQLFAIPPLSEVAFFFDHVHRHDHHYHEPILIVGVNADAHEVGHMVEELLPVF